MAAAKISRTGTGNNESARLSAENEGNYGERC
jgi:hypothetical protein